MKTTLTTPQITANVFGSFSYIRYDSTTSFDGIPVEVEYEEQEADGTPGSRPFYKITSVRNKEYKTLLGEFCAVVLYAGVDIQDLIGRAAVEALEEQLQSVNKEL